MEGEVEEGGAGDEEHLNVGDTSALSEWKKGACGLSFRSRLMLHAWGWLHPQCCWGQRAAHKGWP